MNNKNHRSTLFGILLLTAITVHAQDSGPSVQGDVPDAPVHWALASFFGTGWYQVSANRSVYVLRIPPRQTVRESSLSPSGERTIGIEIKYPVTLGYNQVDELPDFIDFDNFGTASFTPGIELEIPVTERWYLRPNAHFGWGAETETDSSAWIFYGGIKSRFTPGNSRIDWSLLNAINYAGYRPDRRDVAYTGSFMTGFEVRQPLKFINWGGGGWRLNWHIKYSYLFDKLNFYVDDNTTQSIRDEWELGLALSQGNQNLKIWFVEFEHIGLALRWSSDSDYRAIAINLRSPFTY